MHHEFMIFGCFEAGDHDQARRVDGGVGPQGGRNIANSVVDDGQFVQRGDAVGIGQLPFRLADIHNRVGHRRGETLSEPEHAPADRGDAVRNSPSVWSENSGDSGCVRREPAKKAGFRGVSRDQVGFDPQQRLL